MTLNVRVADSSRTLRVFGLPIEDTTLEHAARRIVDAAGSKKPMRIAFINAHCVNMAHKDRAYRSSLRSFDALFADGIGMRIAAQASGQDLIDNVNGTDLFPYICEEAVEKKVPIFLLGAAKGRADEVARRMAAAYPGLSFAGTHHGFFASEDDEARVIDQINSSGAGILFVALGVPAQEIWIERNRDRLTPKVILGVGALFDFYSGAIARAPLPLRKAGLEWAWRLALEPRRLWNRYVVGNIEFLTRVLIAKSPVVPVRGSGIYLPAAANENTATAANKVGRVSRQVYSDAARGVSVLSAAVAGWFMLASNGQAGVAPLLVPAFVAMLYVLSQRFIPDCTTRFKLRDMDGVLISHVLSAASALLLATAVNGALPADPVTALMWTASSSTAGLLAFVAAKWFARSRMMRNRLRARLAIFGSGPISARVIEELQIGDAEIDFVGLYEDRSKDRLVEGSAPISGTFADLVDRAKYGDVDDVLIALPQTAARRIRECANRLAAYSVNVHVCTHVASEYPSRHISEFRTSMLGDVGLLQLRARPLGDWSALLKRCEDIAIGGVLFVTLLPLMALIALAIKIDSAGPVFFAQDRTGLNHRRFRVLKFRTMRVMENGDHVTQATRNDTRFTRIGKFLRRASLDELPQLWNVLVGDMSLVGPRPHAVAHDVHFASIIQRYSNRHQVKPGLTGLAQVNGFRGETPQTRQMAKRLQHDLWYIENWSLLLDLKIILQTPFVCLLDKKAY